MLDEVDETFEQRCARSFSTGGPVLVDFDHTLFACNSTELFIASCKPSSLAAIIDFAVRQCFPWRLTGVKHWFRLRDYVCCCAILLCSPWNLLIWRQIAPRLFAERLSVAVSDALSGVAVDRLTIITFGLDFIVRPLVRDSRWQDVRLIATKLRPNLRDLTGGKLPLAIERLGAPFVAGSIFMSDSRDDDDLLAAAGSGILVEPQGDAFRTVEHLYLPLRYTARAKYTRSYVLDQVVFVETLLAFISVVRRPSDLLTELPLVVFLMLSLMCVYEIGYHENDFVAARSETAPVLTDHLERFRSYPLQLNAWLWAGAMGALARLLGQETGALHFSVKETLIWVGCLTVVRAVFWAYNRVELRARIFLYPVLQSSKFLPIFLIVSPTTVGAVLVLCQILTMWTIYLVYRIGGSRRDIGKEAIRTVMIALGLCLLATTSSLTAALAFPLALVLLWCLARLAKAPFLRLIRRRAQSVR